MVTFFIKSVIYSIKKVIALNNASDQKIIKLNLILKYFQNITAYYKEALDEFERCLEVRKKQNVALDTATTHRFLGETLCKLGNDYERAKRELDVYYSMTLRINDLVETQRAQTTLGNYFMALAEDNYKGNLNL